LPFKPPPVAFCDGLYRFLQSAVTIQVVHSQNGERQGVSPSSASTWNLSKINFSIPNAAKFAALSSPVGGATGVLYARRSTDGIFTGGRTESGLTQFASLIADRPTCRN